jgi:predicted nucleic acid-binding protein
VSFAYLDTSAFVKLIVEEPESERLGGWLAGRPERASCVLLRTEAIRAVSPHGSAAVAAARAAFRTLRLVALDDRLLDAAGDLDADVRSLDAIHLAAALALGPDLDVLVTYDERMRAGANALGVAAIAP